MINPSEPFDAIVVGTGISGGWAAKELCEQGLKTLVLERGHMVRHLEDYPTANLDDWDLPHRNTFSREEQQKFHKQLRVGWAPKPDVAHFFVNDLEHPYQETKRFDWIRGYQVGGRSLTWGRQSYRWSNLDFEANKKEGIGVDWPVRYEDIAPWYDKVETYIGVSGEALGLPHLPDGKFEPPRRSPADHRPGGPYHRPGSCPRRPEPLPVPKPLLEGVPVRGLFQQQFLHAPGSGTHRQYDSSPEFHRT